MSNSSVTLAAIDLGASSGRVIVGQLAGGRLDLTEVHRFGHEPQQVGSTLRWDWATLLAGVHAGLREATERFGPPAAVSCDSWAVDFGLLDAAGKLLEPPACYRDQRTNGMPQSFSDIIPPDDLVARVGAMALPIITLCQLRYMAQYELDTLTQARSLLHISDLIHQDLTGVAATDRTMATASGLRSLAGDDWDRDLLQSLGIPTHFLPSCLDHPAILGTIPADRAPHPDLAGLPVISTAGHDTAAASVVSPREDHVFLSCGTWSMLGTLSAQPVVTPTMATDMLESIGAGNGGWLLMCPLTGLWPLQQCMLQWRKSGEADSWGELIAAAGAITGPISTLVDVGHPLITGPGDMIAAIANYCSRTGQTAPSSAPEMTRVLLQSLALEHFLGVESQQRTTGRQFTAMRLVGGGSANALLCQWTADAIGLPVIAGPMEATALGNMLLQAQVLGLIGDDVSGIVEASAPAMVYQPQAAPDAGLVARYRDLKEKQA
ncbi:MAG: FGGY-family carbohydrate kinase [Armatimonadia bacterium]